MASHKTYPCFQCEKAGHKEVQVFLDGKDENGRTKYLNEDGTRHTHLGSSQPSENQVKIQMPKQEQQQPNGGDGNTMIGTELVLFQINQLSKKLDKIVTMLENVTSRYFTNNKEQ